MTEMNPYALDPEIFDKCADDISRDGGWIQKTVGEWDLPDTPVCALGALARHAYSAHDYRFYDNHATFLDNTAGGPGKTVPYNDAPGRTAGEVADLFRQCAKRIREVQSNG